MDEVAEKANEWQMIAVHLDIDTVYIERWEHQERGVIQACFYQVFTKWQKQLKPPFTWTVIVGALESESVGRLTLANDLRKKYLS